MSTLFTRKEAPAIITAFVASAIVVTAFIILVASKPNCLPHETAVFSEWPWQFGWYCGRRA